MYDWNGCKEEKCKLWDDGYCKLSEGYREYCKRNGESFQPKVFKLISEETIKTLGDNAAIVGAKEYYQCLNDLKDLLDEENEQIYHPKASKEQEWEASSEKHEKCRFCDSTETFRKFSIVSLNSKGEVDGSRDIICEPICFNCMKESALKGELI
jgi:hypothetical protein